MQKIKKVMILTPDIISEELEKRLSALPLDRSPELLYDPIKYILEDGGKRMRPLLTVLGAQIYDADTSAAWGPALAVEVFHNFTLLHDDIMDRAPLRRGRQTVHKRWSDNIAILSGDAMVILAYGLLSEGFGSSSKLLEGMRIFNKAAVEVCEGQQMDMDFESEENVAIEKYIEMIRLKTSALMAASLELGALAGGATEAQRGMLYKFGEDLGLAFQIQDDILDTYGDARTFGKTIGGDIAVGKKTYLYIKAWGLCTEAERGVLSTSRDYATIRALYDKYDVRGESDKAVELYFSRAMEMLAGCHPDPARLEPMASYANQLLKRNK